LSDDSGPPPCAADYFDNSAALAVSSAQRVMCMPSRAAAAARPVREKTQRTDSENAARQPAAVDLWFSVRDGSLLERRRHAGNLSAHADHQRLAKPMRVQCEREV